MPFWIALIYQGARAGGLREARNISLEGLQPCFPDDCLDSLTAQEHTEEERKFKEEKHNRYLL